MQLVGPQRRQEVIDLELADATEPNLMKRIRAYDPALVVYYDRGVAKWGVARASRGGLHFVMLWQGDKGEYLPLDGRLLDALQRFDLRPARLNAPRSADQEADRRDARDLAYAANSDARFDKEISYLTRQNTRRIIRALEAL